MWSGDTPSIRLVYLDFASGSPYVHWCLITHDAAWLDSIRCYVPAASSDEQDARTAGRLGGDWNSIEHGPHSGRRSSGWQHGPWYSWLFLEAGLCGSRLCFRVLRSCWAGRSEIVGLFGFVLCFRLFRTKILIAVFGWLVSQPASSTVFSYWISISHQLSASQQYCSLITNQHQPPAIAKRTQRLVRKQRQLFYR